MTFPYCPDCEVHHYAGACDLVDEFRRQDNAIAEEQLALAFGLRCEWRGDDGCSGRATTRVVIVGPSGFMIEDRVLCNDHADTTSLADAHPGYRVTSWLLSDPAAPKLVLDTPDVADIIASGDPENPTLPEDRADIEAHDVQNALAERGAYEESER